MYGRVCVCVCVCSSICMYVCIEVGRRVLCAYRCMYSMHVQHCPTYPHVRQCDTSSHFCQFLYFYTIETSNVFVLADQQTKPTTRRTNRDRLGVSGDKKSLKNKNTTDLLCKHDGNAMETNTFPRNVLLTDVGLLSVIPTILNDFQNYFTTQDKRIKKILLVPQSPLSPSGR